MIGDRLSLPTQDNAEEKTHDDGGHSLPRLAPLV
jgi:hypothetical protein